MKGRPKHLYSIYNKMKQQKLEFTDLYDLIALRIIVHTRPECYHALGVVSATWTPIPGMYTDYIAQSKSNLYQSLHTKVLGPKGTPLEVQIRTWEMHRTAEFGIAAHWQYKEGGKTSEPFERRLSFLRQQMFDWQADSKDPNEFMRNITDDLFTDQVFVMTPKGDVIDLPTGSSPVDFAYRVHSAVGEHCVGAKVNGRMVPLCVPGEERRRAGDHHASQCQPEPRLAGFCEVVARPHQNQSLFQAPAPRGKHPDRARAAGKRAGATSWRTMPNRGAKIRATSSKTSRCAACAHHFNMPNEVELLASVGYGTVAAMTVLNRLKPAPDRAGTAGQTGGKRADDRKLRITAGGMEAENVVFRRSRCCLPIPGDDVIGYVTMGQGMALHRRECPNAQQYLDNEPTAVCP